MAAKIEFVAAWGYITSIHALPFEYIIMRHTHRDDSSDQSSISSGVHWKEEEGHQEEENQRRYTQHKVVPHSWKTKNERKHCLFFPLKQFSYFLDVSPEHN